MKPFDWTKTVKLWAGNQNNEDDNVRLHTGLLSKSSDGCAADRITQLSVSSKRCCGLCATRCHRRRGGQRATRRFWREVSEQHLHTRQLMCEKGTRPHVRPTLRQTLRQTLHQILPHFFEEHMEASLLRPCFSVPAADTVGINLNLHHVKLELMVISLLSNNEEAVVNVF